MYSIKVPFLMIQHVYLSFVGCFQLCMCKVLVMCTIQFGFAFKKIMKWTDIFGL